MMISNKHLILQGEIEDLTISADKLALKAEKHKNFTYLMESNEEKKIWKVKKTEMEELKVVEQKLNKSLSENIVWIATATYMF